MRDRPTPSETMVRAVIEQIEGWKSATFAWQGDPDPAVAERNKIAAIEAHASECLRRIRATLALGVTAYPARLTKDQIAQLAPNAQHWLIENLKDGVTAGQYVIAVRAIVEAVETAHGVGVAASEDQTK